MDRIFIIDPVCAMTYGHSLNALGYFADMARAYGDSVIKVASRHLPQTGAGDDGIERFFEFQYDRFLDITRQPPLQDWAGIYNRVHIGPEAASSTDFSRFLQSYKITADDTLLFPSVDYYALLGLLNALVGQPVARLPKIMLRFIGVMETAGHDIDPPTAANHFRRRLREALTAGVPISICAETPKYARELETALRCKVHTVPYMAPDITALPLPDDGGPITFLSGGSAREDKGFYRLRNIISLVHNRIDVSKVRFVIQGPPDALFHRHPDYMAWLHSLPNAEILPGTVPYSEIERAFQNSHVSLMPYDQATYSSRGSAMLMETMLFNRLALCQGGTGFAEQCMLYNSGLVCNTDDDFADAIAMYAGLGPTRIEQQAALARAHYLEDVKQACDAWMKGEAL